MTTFLLIRHALTCAVGHTLSGHTPGIPLSHAGVLQAEQLAHRLATRGAPQVIYSSPLQRALETAAAIAARVGLQPQRCSEAIEVDFGKWTGRSFELLQEDRGWRRWNELRSWAEPEQGEMMIAVQARIVSGLARLARVHPSARVALVSHGDVIKAALAYALGSPLELLQRIEVSPASVSTLLLDAHGPRVVSINDVGDAS